MRGLFHYSRIKARASEYHRMKICASMEWKFIYFFNSSIIVKAMSVGRKNLGDEDITKMESRMTPIQERRMVRTSPH